MCVGLVLGQLVLGGVIRHQPSLLMARLHILGAFLVLAGLLWLAKLRTPWTAFARWAWVLLGLVGLEIVLGVETGVHWMARVFPAGPGGERNDGRIADAHRALCGRLAVVCRDRHRGASRLIERMFSLVRTIKPAVDDVPALAGQSLQGGVA